MWSGARKGGLIIRPAQLPVGAESRRTHLGHQRSAGHHRGVLIAQRATDDGAQPVETELMHRDAQGPLAI